MKFKIIGSLVIFLLGLQSIAAIAAHFSFTTTSINATVAIQTSANPNIGGVPLVTGDEIGAFKPNGLCVGLVVWTGVNTALSVYGAEGPPTNLPGIAAGEAIGYRVWRNSQNKEFTTVNVTYSMGDGVFQANGLYVLSSLSAQAYLLTMAVDPVGSGTTTPAVGSYQTNPNEVVNISATGSGNYIFNNWTGGPVANPNSSSTTITMSASKTATANFRIPYGTIGNRVWQDIDKDGIQDAGEPGIDGVTVALWLPADGSPLATTTTASGGAYLFTNVLPGNYVVEFVLLANYQFTLMDQGADDSKDSDANTSTGRTAPYIISADEIDNNIDAGMYPQPATIGNFVWRDTDKDGIQDAGEPGLDGVTVRLYTSANTLAGTTTTAGGGAYSFSNVNPGDYYVKFTLLANYSFSPKDAGGDDTADSDADATTGQTVVTTLSAAESDQTWDAGMYPAPATIGNFVWKDTDQDGIQDAGEPGLSGVTVEMYTSADALVNTTTTDAGGLYSFNNNDPGNYYVKFALLANYNFSPKDAGTDNTKDSDTDVVTGKTAVTTLTAGESDLTWDAGMFPQPRVTNPNEPGLLWEVGSAQTIRWTGFSGSYVKIGLYKAGILNLTISSSTANTGSFVWTIPTTKTLGSDYKIRITSLTNNLMDDSDYDFSIVGRPKVTYPTATSIGWKIGSEYTITWEHFQGTQVNIYLYKGTVLDRTIATATDNDGSFSWIVPVDQTLGATYKIKVESVSDPTKNDLSDNAFAIGQPKVTNPDAADVIWDRGKNVTIQWTGYQGSYVNIYLFKAGSLNMTIVASTPNDGTHTWLVPTTHTLGSDYRIKIVSTSFALDDLSDNDFRIMGTPIVRYPSATKIGWEIEHEYTITWDQFKETQVNIYLYKGTVLDRTIATATDNDGSFSWIVPVDQTLGATYKIKVESASDPTKFDLSDNAFAIGQPKVTNPDAADVIWDRSKNATIQWTGYQGSYVNIYLFKAGSLNTTIVASTPNDGTHTWLVPTTQTLGLDYRIKIVSTSFALDDMSDNDFQIMGTPIVLYPSATKIGWEIEHEYTITWDQFKETQVNIYLYKGTVLDRTIATATDNDGSFAWTVPVDQTLGTTYKIKVESASDPTKYDMSDNAFAIGQPKVTDPDSEGIVWGQAMSYTIRWTGYQGSYVNIYLFKGGILNTTIVATTPNDGSHSWTVPTTQTKASDYQIKITSTSFSLTDLSDYNFTIVGLPKVTYPNETDITWQTGATYTIMWQDLLYSTVNIKLYKGTTLNRTIASAIANTGSYEWTVPGNQTLGADFKMRVEASTNTAKYDLSDNYFTIAALPAFPAPSVVYPTAATLAWHVGSAYTIKWNGYDCSKVKIELYKGGALNRTIASSTANDWSYAWTVPLEQTQGADFEIRISSEDGTLEDYSDNEFRILGKPMVTYPSAASIVLQRGLPYTLTWSDYSDVNVKILLYQGTVLDRTITSATANDGSYDWTVPTTQTIGSGFKIMIQSTVRTTEQDYSDYSFSITSQVTVAVPKVTYPTAAGVIWQLGSTYTIKWNGFTSAKVKIDLYKGGTIDRTIGPSTENDWQYTWTVPMDLAPGSDYKVRISSTVNPAQYDESDNFFTVGAVLKMVEAPVVEPEGEFIASSVDVYMACPSRGANIHYTLDGTEPTEASPVFEGPFTLDRSAVIKARAFKQHLIPSPVVELSYVLQDSINMENETVEDIPETYRLFQNYPNPFNSETTILYNIPQAGKVEMRVYNILGEEVTTLVDEIKEAGKYIVRWDGRDRNGKQTADGLYLCRIEVGKYQNTISMLLVK